MREGLQRNFYLCLLGAVLIVWCAVNLEHILVSGGLELDPAAFEANAIAGVKSKSGLATTLDAFATLDKGLDKSEKMPLTASAAGAGAGGDLGASEEVQDTGGSYGTTNSKFNRII